MRKLLQAKLSLVKICAQKTESFTCVLEVMTPDELQQYEALKTQLRTSVKELVDGYAFRYEPDAAPIMAAVEFITRESQCCPFYEFSLEKGSSGGLLWLRITGPEGTKSFIKDALVS